LGTIVCSVGHCVFFFLSVYGFWWPFSYFQTKLWFAKKITNFCGCL
jgi:hypothetical protein